MTALVALAKRSESHNRSSGGDCLIINYGKLSTNVIPWSLKMSEETINSDSPSNIAELKKQEAKHIYIHTQQC